MKINFKSIHELRDFDFLPLNLLDGVNSSSKNSINQSIKPHSDPIVIYTRAV